MAPSTTRSAIFTLIPSLCSASHGLTSSSPEPRFLAAALDTLSVLDQHFESPTGGYHSVLPGDASKREQNPHMHLFEAMLAWFEATGREMFLARAAELYGMMAARFFQHRTGILAEYFDGSWNPREGIDGRICEPGHHFEWSWLLRRYAALSGRGDSPVAQALKEFGDRHGFDSEGFVVDELLDDGRVHKTSRRCWPHTEAIKAEVAAAETGDEQAAARAAQTIDRLLAAFLGRPVAGGWIDHVDANGAPIVDPMPASTLYHVFLAAAEADRVWGEQGTASESKRPISNERRGDPAGGDSGGRQGHAARRDYCKPFRSRCCRSPATGRSSTISSR